MREDSLKQLVLGGVLIVVGLGLVVFRKAIRRVEDNWNKRVPWPLQSHGPRGDSFEGFLILFAAFLLLVGIINLILPFCSPMKMTHYLFPITVHEVWACPLKTLEAKASEPNDGSHVLVLLVRKRRRVLRWTKTQALRMPHLGTGLHHRTWQSR